MFAKWLGNKLETRDDFDVLGELALILKPRRAYSSAVQAARQGPKEIDMTELIKVIVSIKDPFTLLAFFAVILLLAFRTKKVPESLFRLVGQKINRDRFYVLVNRLFLYSFAVFVVLCGIAVLGQVLSYLTTAKVASVEELKQEVALRTADDAASQRAITEYQKAIELSGQNKIDEAIAALQASLRAVPTATARETLALLYQKAGNRNAAIRSAEQAVLEARGSEGAVQTVRAERLLASVTTPTQTKPAQSCPPSAGLVGAKLNLPPGGGDFETATLLTPCVYAGQFDVEQSEPVHYKVALEAGQTIRVVLRTRAVDAASATVRMHGPDGGFIHGSSASTESTLTSPLEYKADESGSAYVTLTGGVRGSALEISVK
jgi:hypothetical protein